MILGQLAERLGDRLMLFNRLDAIVRGLAIERERDGLLIGHRAGPLLGSIRIDGEIARDAEEPASECGPRLEGIHTCNSACEGLLADIFRVLTICHEVAAEAI